MPLPPAPNAERVPVMPAPEQGIERTAERKEQAAEARAAVSDFAAPVAAATPAVDPVQSDASATAGPVVAANDDVIEKEWVDRAKDIVAKTKDDPHARADQVNTLQKDYLQKRYGKVIGASQ
jgi:hypothetical protein